jgi:hypothetical protein
LDSRYFIARCSTTTKEGFFVLKIWNGGMLKSRVWREDKHPYTNIKRCC